MHLNPVLPQAIPSKYLQTVIYKFSRLSDAGGAFSVCKKTKYLTQSNYVQLINTQPPSFVLSAENNIHREIQ